MHKKLYLLAFFLIILFFGCKSQVKNEKAKIFIVEGIVQGVGYRDFTQEAASSIGLKGFISNKTDGTVEVYAIGTDTQLEMLKQKLKEGPARSKVENIVEKETKIDMKYKNFKIKQ